MMEALGSHGSVVLEFIVVTDVGVRIQLDEECACSLGWVPRYCINACITVACVVIPYTTLYSNQPANVLVCV